MKKLTITFMAVCAVASSPANANLLNDFVGTWQVTTTLLVNGREVSLPSQNKIRRLPGGVVYSVTAERINGKQVITAKEWALPGGVSLSVGYSDNGRTKLLGEGTWNARGNVLSGTYSFETLQGRIAWSGTATRINRNRWVQNVSITDQSGSMTGRSVYTRIR